MEFQASAASPPLIMDRPSVLGGRKYLGGSRPSSCSSWADLSRPAGWRSTSGAMTCWRTPRRRCRRTSRSSAGRWSPTCSANWPACSSPSRRLRRAALRTWSTPPGSRTWPVSASTPCGRKTSWLRRATWRMPWRSGSGRRFARRSCARRRGRQPRRAPRPGAGAPLRGWPRHRRPRRPPHPGSRLPSPTIPSGSACEPSWPWPRTGRQRDAAALDDARRTLVEEVGIDPGADFPPARGPILEQDPALDVSMSAVPIAAAAAVPASPAAPRVPAGAAVAQPGWLPLRRTRPRPRHPARRRRRSRGRHRAGGGDQRRARDRQDLPGRGASLPGYLDTTVAWGRCPESGAAAALAVHPDRSSTRGGRRPRRRAGLRGVAARLTARPRLDARA